MLPHLEEYTITDYAGNACCRSAEQGPARPLFFPPLLALTLLVAVCACSGSKSFLSPDISYTRVSAGEDSVGIGCSCRGLRVLCGKESVLLCLWKENATCNES